MGAIYSILNKKDGKIYVGQSINPKKRLAQHKSNLRGNYHRNTHLQRAWNKYGESSFEFGILENCSDESLNDNETWWINYFDSTNQDKGYNYESGGNSDYKVSDESRKKMSQNHFDVSGENNPFYGKKHSEESLRKMRETKAKQFALKEDKPTITKKGFKNGKQCYGLRYKGKYICYSISREKLEKKIEELEL